LEWVTASENIQHAYNIGTKKTPNGEKSWCSKLNNKQISEIYISKEPHKILAERYNIHKDHVSVIKRGKMWSHITKGLIRGRQDKYKHPTSKVCKRCSKEKLSIEFSSANSVKYLNTYCKSCESELNAIRHLIRKRLKQQYAT
jgi:hypothetical protein